MRVLIADGHRLMLKVLRVSLEEAEGFEVVGEARYGSHVLPLVRRLNPDLVLLGAWMPEIDGLRALELIRQGHPGVKVVMFAGTDEPGAMTAASEGGAAAFVAKTIDPGELPSVLQQAAEATVFRVYGIPENRPAAADEAGLSKQELVILKALVSGRSNRQIAKEMWLAEQTVKFHLSNIYRKIGVRNRTEAVRYAYRHGLLENPALEPTRQQSSGSGRRGG